MWPFRRRRPEPTGTVRVGELSPDEAAYDVFVVSESRYLETYAELWATATDDERARARMLRWATLVPVRDPAFGIAEIIVQFAGRTACYLRPPHLGQVAARLDQENAAALEVPALIARGPVGPEVRLIVDV